jgi:hypothetical protein
MAQPGGLTREAIQSPRRVRVGLAGQASVRAYVRPFRFFGPCIGEVNARRTSGRGHENIR